MNDYNSSILPENYTQEDIEKVKKQYLLYVKDYYKEWHKTSRTFIAIPTSKPKHYFNKITNYIKGLFKPAKQPLPVQVVQRRSHTFSKLRAGIQG